MEVLSAKKAAASGDERGFEVAVLEALTELTKATQQMREANAAFQAETRTQQEETARRLSLIEAREERRAERREAASEAVADEAEPEPARGGPLGLGALVVQLRTQWQIVTLAGMGVVEAVQLVAPHISWH